MHTKKLYLASAPALMMFNDSLEERARQGTLLFYHGFGDAKESYPAVLERFAQAGFGVVSVDGIGHGERRYPDFAQRFPPIEPPLAGSEQLEAAFLAVVSATALEVPSIIDELIARKWAQAGRIGIAGLSFGGFVSYAAVVADKRIQVAASVVGSPQWRLPLPESPHLHPERFFPTALLSLVGGRDTNVLPEFARALHERLEPYYAQSLERLSYVEYPDAPHIFSPADWEKAWERVTVWFQTHFPSF